MNLIQKYDCRFGHTLHDIDFSNAIWAGHLKFVFDLKYELSQTIYTFVHNWTLAVQNLI